MTSAPVPREPADPPSVNVLRSSLALFSLYIATTVIVSLALAAASIDLHPATRFFIWLVMSAAVGYGLLRRHGRYPSPPTLGLILGLAIFWILGMSVAATLRLDDSAEASGRSWSTCCLFSHGGVCTPRGSAATIRRVPSASRCAPAFRSSSECSSLARSWSMSFTFRPSR